MGKFIKHGNFYLCSSCKETEDSCTCEAVSTSLHDITDDAYHTRRPFQWYDSGNDESEQVDYDECYVDSF